MTPRHRGSPLGRRDDVRSWVVAKAVGAQHVVVESSPVEPLERAGTLGMPQALLALGRPGADGR